MPPYDGEGKRSHANLWVKHQFRLCHPKVYSDEELKWNRSTVLTLWCACAFCAADMMIFPYCI